MLFQSRFESLHPSRSQSTGNGARQVCGFWARRQGVLSVLGLAFALFFNQNQAEATYVGIRYDLGAARQAGQLCEEQLQVDAELNQLRIRWNAARLDLGRDQDGLVRGRCLVRIPAMIPVGYRIAELTSRAQSRVNKPSGLEATVNLATTLSVLPPLESESYLTSETSFFGRENTYKEFDGLKPLVTDWDRELCSPGRASELILGVNLGAVIQRNWGDAAASLDFSGADYGVDLWIELLPCPAEI